MMITAAPSEFENVLEQVGQWPISDRIALARKILESAIPNTADASRAYSAEEVIALLKMPQPAPDDAECEHILEDELLRKHG